MAVFGRSFSRQLSPQLQKSDRALVSKRGYGVGPLLKDGLQNQAGAGRAKGVAAPSDEGLVAQDLGKSFKGRAVVNGVSLRLKRGEVLGLLGPNGAGKTTCFYMVMGLIQPDFGQISIDGQDVTDLPMYVRARLGLGYLPQEPSIFRGMSVEDNVLAVLETVEPNAKARMARCDQLLDELRIDRLRKQRSTSLSGGERRRLEIARALATDPSFILLDEPFAGIDPLAIADIRDLIGFLKGRGIGVLITDHNVRDTLNIIDRATIIFDGEVLFEGSPDEVLNQPDVRRVYLGEDFKA
jgi:lipopolysaccharide export system ATP-binding protein